MKITIDTKEDTHEDFNKVIKMLSAMKEQKIQHSNIFDDSIETIDTNEEPSGPEPPESGGLFNMFGSSDTSLESEPSETPSETSSEIIEEEPVEEKPQVQVYEY